LQTEPNQIHSEPNPSFFKNRTETEQKFKNSIPHTPSKKVNYSKQIARHHLPWSNMWTFVWWVTSFAPHLGPDPVARRLMDTV